MLMFPGLTRLARCAVEMVYALALVLLFTGLVAFFWGGIWGLVDWMRNFGTGAAALPYLDQRPQPSTPYATQLAVPWLKPVRDLIDWHNLFFRGATRFGSGVGIVLAGLMSIRFLKRLGTPARALGGACAGALIGGRVLLMITSDAHVVLAGYLLGASLGILFCLLPRKPELSPLPSLRGESAVAPPKDGELA